MWCAFPQERRIAPSIESVRDMASLPVLVASMMEERAGSMSLALNGGEDHVLCRFDHGSRSWAEVG